MALSGALSGVASKEASQSLTQRLKVYGLAGVVAYGLLNTVYYTAMFTYMWTVGFKVPRGLGYAEAARKLVEVLGITWAGSQLTKAARAAGALLLAPVVDKGLGAFQRALHLKSRRTAFLYIVALCLGLTAALFGTVVVVHA
ncbi:hypothetical protein COCSUDRAFT_59680 [Coccomyxa subellipsoidea C-169]|uniref:Uncharacterized protein n=1 Tax=Coccomyxa subellipsoidea (strain C-169) TaxID=574566 RepID=I0YLC7_COCSC|nr:hypothetical protein COCSUDRAFT_59680 [Coccomyxa subellipsoidea C-169]EIE19196.1 hypothetical protein COCSUDRAFT_59680 [Coccomyxa subellipsoidea C-169]|eukprot:XP_005643740.1 hypothetical protein COCSUDRAFT_59680 [Coccomyxa subellipsoidea C-169]